MSDPSFENGNPPRSPGFKNVFGAGAGRAPPLSDEILSPTDEGFANRDRGSFSRPGVKRTKSLMQKIKSMVRQRPDESMPPVPAWGERSKSMSAASPTAGILRPSGYGAGGAAGYGYGLESAVMEEENGGVEPGTVNFADPIFGERWDPASGHPISKADGEVGRSEELRG